MTITRTVPWWSLVGVILLLVYHPNLGGVDFHGFQFTDTYVEGRDPSEPTRRHHAYATERIRRHLSDDKVSAAIKMSEFNISIPCLRVPFAGNLAKPCGEVTITPKGRDIHTPFGTKHMPGSKVFEPAMKKFEKSFESYTAYLVAGVAAVYAALTLLVPSMRQKLIQTVRDACAGKLEDDDPTEDPVDKEEELKDRMDPKSDNFIAPGNIYRLLAVLHPGKVGLYQWAVWTSKALVCAYMQLYLPIKIVKTVFDEWEFHGVKSPLWFISQGGAFFTMFISVGSICNIFACKCSENIRRGAEANFYILTHSEPPGQLEGEYQPLTPKETLGLPVSLQSQISLPKMPASVVNVGEYFFCCLSFACNVAMSFLLFVAMFLKIATFTGKITQVAMVAVALYFVFDLDDKVMDSDPKLRRRYRAAVLKQTVETSYKPIWLLTNAALARAILGALTPFGLGMIVLIAWKSDHEVIGGDPF